MRNKKQLAPILILLAFSILGLVWFQSRTPDLPDKPHNIIVICIDTLRADHLGCYGYKRNTSPHIDKLAREGILFEQAQSHSSFTRESVSTIMTGRLPSRSGSTGWFAEPNRDVPTLGSIFSKAGYHTALISAMHMLALKGFNQGFEKSTHFSESRFSGNSPLVSQKAIDFMRQDNRAPFLLYLHYLDPHSPYEPPDETYLRFAPYRFPTDPSIHSTLRLKCRELMDNGFRPGDPRFEDMILRYDAEIAHTDQAIGTLVAALEEMNLLKNTLIVITADHGEEFLEHGFVEHGWTLNRECTHVPLIFWSKAMKSGKRVPEPVSLVSILPTLLKLADLHDPVIPFDGSPLFSIRKGQTVPNPQPLHIGELLVQSRNMGRSVVNGSWKYLEYLQWHSPEQRPERYLMNAKEAYERNPALHISPWSPAVRVELFDLLNDPLERVNLAQERPDLCKMFREQLARYQKTCLSSPPPPRPQQKRKAVSEDELKKLKTLGYL